MINCTFQGNQGQGLQIFSDKNFITNNIFISCTFRNCSTESGGSVYFISLGPSYSTFTNCLFIGNNGTRNGGAIYLKSSNFSFSSCIFQDNSLIAPTEAVSASCYGGTINFQESNGTLYNCTFLNSKILTGESGNFFGGAIFMSNSNQTYEKCNFLGCSIQSNNNQNHPNGGVMSALSSTCFIRDCNFTDNFIVSTKADSESIGGVFTLKSSQFTLEDCFFVNNSLNSNEMSCGSSVLFASKSNVELNRLFFAFNSIQSNCEKAYCIGGSIGIQDSSFIFNECNFSNNFIETKSLESYVRGGTICLSKSEGEINGCIVTNNFVKNSNNAVGGSLFILESKVNLSDSTFCNNCIISGSDYAQNFGGSLTASESDTSFYRCLFENNSIMASNYVAVSYGGAIHISDKCMFDSCIFKENKATSSYKSYGSVIFLDSKDSVFKNCSFLSNLAFGLEAYVSATVYMNPNSKGDFISCNFIGNLVKSQYDDAYGGAVYLNAGTGNFDYCTFKENKVECISSRLSSGSTLYMIESTTGYCNSCIFIENNSTSHEGHSYGTIFMQYGQFNFENCSFIRNECNSFQVQSLGGILCIVGAQIMLLYCSLINNSMKSFSSSQGICIYSQESIVICKKCSLQGNRGKVEDGKIYGLITLIGSSSLLTDCSVNDNELSSVQSSSIGLGGIIYISQGYLNIENSEFFENSVVSQLGQSFGSVFYMLASEVKIDSSLFSGNFISVDSQTVTEGGAIFSQHSSCIITSCNFEGNYAKSSQVNSKISGGAIGCEFSDFIFVECEFTTNFIQSPAQSQFGGSILLFQSNGTFKGCTFCNNTASLSGGAVYLNDGYLNFEQCSFINNNANRGGDIFNQFNTEEFNMIINDCYFEKDCSLDSVTNSLVFVYCNVTLSSANVFVNNEVVIQNQGNIVIFDGTLLNDTQSFWTFEKNCLYPYESQLFIGSSINFIEGAEGGKEVTFDMAFDKYCIYQSSSFIFISRSFTESPVFTESQEFTLSDHFTRSSLIIHFTNSNCFTKSQSFSLSDYFSKSFAFTKSSTFSSSIHFTKSNHFTKSQSFSQSDYFSKSFAFTKSSTFSSSIHFTKSNCFTKSQSFSQSDYFTKGFTFTKSSTFSSSIHFTKSNCFTKSQSFSQSDYFTKGFAFTRTSFFSQSETLPPFIFPIDPDLKSEMDSFTESSSSSMHDSQTELEKSSEVDSSYEGESSLIVETVSEESSSSFETESNSIFESRSSIETDSEIPSETDSILFEPSVQIVSDQEISSDVESDSNSINSDIMSESASSYKIYTESSNDIDSSELPIESNSNTSFDTFESISENSIFDSNDSNIIETNSDSTVVDLNPSIDINSDSDSSYQSVLFDESSHEYDTSSIEQQSKFQESSLSDTTSNSEKLTNTNQITSTKIDEVDKSTDESIFSSATGDFLFIPDPTKSSKKKGIGVGAIVGIVIGILAAIAVAASVVFIVLKKRKLKSEDEGQSRTSFVETKSAKTLSENSHNAEEDEKDLDFWL
ncbi:hypothetical protein M9Y10_031435 [Tritrichomonas musculus]|uniref:Polymorphic outer membrane protein n=1 Tax=Tritrichomonas musculus TaxID=1915356 RepID=A0ABR2H0S2_9EUKA